MPDTNLRVERDSTRGAAFAELISSARRNRGWTQDSVIFKSGVSRSTLIRWEAGMATTPNPDHVRAVCSTLGIDLRDALMALGYLTADDINPAA